MTADDDIGAALERRADRLSGLDLTPWDGMDQWLIGGQTGRWVATRRYCGSELSIINTTLNKVIAACRDFDRRTA